MHSTQANSVTDPTAALLAASSRFGELAARPMLEPPLALHEVGAAISTLCLEMSRAEAAGSSREGMRELVENAREIHSQSPFVRRLQTWPRGYPGDWETIEHLISQENRATPGTIGFVIEQYCLATALAQQHRNKMQRQSKEILGTLLRDDRKSPPAILVLAAGSAPDVRDAAAFIGSRDCRLVLCDTDPDAVARSEQALASLGGRLVTLEGDVVWCSDSIDENGPYDLVVAGGLFDYLDDKWATKTLALVLNEWLAPGGKLYFTNIAAGNPFRLWMTCVADWNVIERTEQDLAKLVSSARASDVSMDIERDATTLAYLVEVALAEA